jgi:hypothetical protein
LLHETETEDKRQTPKHNHGYAKTQTDIIQTEKQIQLNNTGNKTTHSAASMSMVPTVMCSIAVIALTQTGPLWYIDIHIATLKIVAQEVTTPAR